MQNRSEMAIVSSRHNMDLSDSEGENVGITTLAL